MRIVVRKDVYDSVCTMLGIEKAHKYIRRWEKKNGSGWEYEYPSDMPKNSTRKKARNHIAKKTKVITGVRIIKNDYDYEREVNRLKQLSRKGQLKCKALGGENIEINNITIEHTKTTKGNVRPQKEVYHKRMLFSFTEQILKNGVLNEVTRRNSKGRDHITYGIVNMCRYYDEYLDKVVDVPIEIAVAYDDEKKKFVLSAADFEIKNPFHSMKGIEMCVSAVRTRLDISTIMKPYT